MSWPYQRKFIFVGLIVLEIPEERPRATLATMMGVKKKSGYKKI